MDSDQDALRAHVRMRLAFWQAQDRRSITTGPNWLWRGQHVAPLRQSDLSAGTAELIARRRTAGTPTAALFDPSGPRRRRLPRWASMRAAACWAVAATAWALVAMISARATDDRAGIGTVAGWGALLCAGAALAVFGLALWARRDPLNLNAAQIDEVDAARRVLEWNPLAGAGPITPGGGYLLEGIAVVQDLMASPGWALPGADVVRLRFDPDEEIFQIARAAYCLDAHDSGSAALGQPFVVTGLGNAVLRTERRFLTEALLGRLIVLHRCVSTLSELQQRRDQVTSTADSSVPGGALFTAVVENELAAAALNDLNTDLLAMTNAYENIGASANTQYRN
ncbi:hypothetical protein HG717_34105 [Rhodococcus erythropolis]|uniref:hypothetical protein n=1 Tax=Rhodococcus erythropolis TaxID=1833 RepID=UPI001C9B6582|nr:hypothetical protein [Rhodococcus erythropolis]MBY6388904.1 hypothetical protein [Rhodococcus erythropolis]